DELLETEFEEFPEIEGNNHVDEDDDSRKKQNQWCVLNDQRNGCGHTDDHKEYVDQECADFLRTVYAGEVSGYERHEQQGDRREHQVVIPDDPPQNCEEDVCIGGYDVGEKFCEFE